MRTLAIFFLFTSLAWAGDVVVCDPTNPIVPNSVTTYETGIDTTVVPTTNGFLTWNAPHNAMTPERVAFVNTFRAQLDSLQGIPRRHWKCIDSNTDGILDGVTEMTQAEKDLVEAPRLAIQARSQAIDNEKSTNDICNAEPADLDARINTAVDAITNLADAKVFLKAFTKKLARCVWARTTTN